ncbi:MAG: Holliday junction branch migration protein RuvA [Lachnospiraceae bacterium]|nr:Holliday junction branch migration protein RuvA [Lachnospiraceae bacterium]
MIAYIKGILSDYDEESVVVEAGGVGYAIIVPSNVIEALPPIGSDIKIYTYLSVREDAFVLFGFLTKDDLLMFERCISVNGIGPKGGIAILSAFDSDSLRLAIISGDAKAISKANGIGPKTAERLILELKDKVKSDEISFFKASNPANESSASSSAKSEAIEALTALGYSASDAVKAVNTIEDITDMDSEAILKAALKKMF